MAMLMYWTHDCPAPWQTPEWIEQMRQQLRPNAYLRLIENRWVTSESNFVDMAWYDACVDADTIARAHRSAAAGLVRRWIPAVKRDSTAVVAATFDTSLKKVRLVWHRIFQPSPEEPLDFEFTIERTLLELKRRFWLREVRFDPYQMQATAQRLTVQGVPMLEFPQSVPNLTEASTNLYELLKGHNLLVYPDDELRLAISRCVALETTRGWRIAKEKVSHKIDVVVALAQAALGAVKQGQVAGLSADDRAFMQRCQQALHAQEMRRRSCGAFDPAAPVIDYMSARGEDVARAEDRAALRAKARWGRWASW